MKGCSFRPQGEPKVDVVGCVDGWNATNLPVALAARERGLVFGRKKVVVKGARQDRVVIEAGGRRVAFRNGHFNIDDRAQCRTARNKQKTRELLQEIGCNVPRGEVFSIDEESRALGFCLGLGYPVFVKPVDGLKGRGVSKVDSEASMRAAWLDLSKTESFVVVEQFFDAEEYRFACVGGKTIAIVKRIPANVVGDGKLSIRELIDLKNSLKKKERAAPQIKIDASVIAKLEKMGLSLDSVPSSGQIVYLRDNSNVSTGGDSVDFTESVHPGYVEEINKAAEKFKGIVITGWDVFIKDPEAAPSPDNWAVCEVNDGPMIALHHYPHIGKARDVAGAALDFIFGSS